MKKRNFLLFLVITLLLLGFTFAVVNFWDSQSPADIGSLSIFGKSLNISYNISDTNLVFSTINIYYKTNSTSEDITFFQNGSAISGFHKRNYSSNNSDVFNFRLWDNAVYPATYNYNESIMEEAVHSTYDLDDAGVYLKIRLFNVSNLKNYSLFEIYAENQTDSSNTLRIYYCNYSYNTGNPANSDFCTNFYNLPASQYFNHSHSANSKHHLIPFPINKTNGMIGDVYVTNTSYFLLRGRNGINSWNVYYISNISRPDSIQEDTNGGVGTNWVNFSGTVDSHLHQYDGTEKIWYYACANDSLGNQNCTSLRSDLIDLGGIGPSSVGIFSPINQSYKGNLSINYTSALSPNGYAIAAGYNISLYNFSDDFISLIDLNNSLNLTFVWDSISTPDGIYNIHVTGCDINGLCATGESDDFTIDNTAPSGNFNCIPSSINIGEGISCTCTGSDSTSGVETISFTEYPTTGTAGTFIETCIIYDVAGNYINKNFSYTVNYGGSISSGGGSSGETKSKTQPESSIISEMPSGEISSSENKSVNIIVGEETHKLNIIEVNENFVNTIFSYDGSEQNFKIGETKTFEIGEYVVTATLDKIENGIAVFNVLTKEKIVSGLNLQKIVVIVGLIIFTVLLSIILIKKKPRIKRKKSRK
ncbi:hypothetical protein M0R19_01680 [Candidatus Pacearchaeota archaeon]|nr:hypothetical protein [Candidatus Pacearchaeota archaeon]